MALFARPHRLPVAGFEFVHHPLCDVAIRDDLDRWCLPWYRCVKWRLLIGRRAFICGTCRETNK